MERLNKETLSFSAKIVGQIFGALGLMLFLTACPGKDGGGAITPVPTIIGINGCSNCTGITSPMLLATFQTESADKTIALTNMQMYGQSTNIMANYSGSSASYYNYQGPIAIQGVLEVRAPVYDYSYNYAGSTGCILQPGSYPIQTYSVGQISYYGFDLYVPAMLTTVGGIELKIMADSTNYGMGFTNGGTRLYTAVAVTRVNGIQCSADFYGPFN